MRNTLDNYKGLLPKKVVPFMGLVDEAAPPAKIVGALSAMHIRSHTRNNGDWVPCVPGCGVVVFFIVYEKNYIYAVVQNEGPFVKNKNGIKTSRVNREGWLLKLEREPDDEIDTDEYGITKAERVNLVDWAARHLTFKAYREWDKYVDYYRSSPI